MALFPVRPNYSYRWGRGTDVSDLTAVLATRMRKERDTVEHDFLSIEKLYLAILQVYKDWYRTHQRDPELRALLSVAAACRWLHEPDAERLTDLCEMLAEVTDAFHSPHSLDAVASCGINCPAHRHFCRKPYHPPSCSFTEQGISEVLSRTWGAVLEECLVEADGFEVSFTGADNGEGTPFDGILFRNDHDGLQLINETLEERRVFQGSVTPATESEIEAALTKGIWCAAPLRLRNGAIHKKTPELSSASVGHYAGDYNYRH